MPTSRESVPNRPLSGAELKQLLLDDFVRLMDGEGALVHYAAFSRVGYTITLELHTNNLLSPESRISLASKAPPANLSEAQRLAHPGMHMLLPPPVPRREICSNCGGGIEDHHANADETWHCELDPPGDYVPVIETPEVAAIRLDRNVTSPNVERLRVGLPVPVDRKQQDGTILTEELIYPPDAAAGEGDVTVTDVSQEARAKWAALDKPLP